NQIARPAGGWVAQQSLIPVSSERQWSDSQVVLASSQKGKSWPCLARPALAIDLASKHQIMITSCQRPCRRPYRQEPCQRPYRQEPCPCRPSYRRSRNRQTRTCCKPTQMQSVSSREPSFRVRKKRKPCSLDNRKPGLLQMRPCKSS